MDFETVWKSGPWQLRGKAAAERAWNRLTKDERGQFLIAVDEYWGYCKQNKWYSPCYGSSFFVGRRNGWRDWVPEKKTEDRDDTPSRTSGSAELMAQASAIVRAAERNLLVWQRAAKEHIHNGACQNGLLCVYANGKTPKVPTVEAVLARLSAGN